MKKVSKILVVDDSEFQRSLLALELEHEGYAVVKAENGLEALNYLKTCKDLPCLILSDLFMPEVDGFQLCSRVKELYPGIPVIILTVSNNEDNLKKAFSLGASDYLGKPFTLTEVITRVSNVLTLTKAEREILRSKKELEEIFNTAADWMRVIDFDYNVLRVNDALANKLGKSKDMILGKKCYETFPGLNCDTAECTVHRMKRITGKFEVDTVKQINSSYCSCILSATPFTDDNGKVVGVVENFKDITERKVAEQKLKDSEAKYRGLIDFTDTGYLIMDTSGRVIDANKIYVKFTGHKTLSEIKGKTVFEWTAEHDLEKNKQEVKRCFDEGSVGALEIDYVDRNNKITSIEVFAKVVTVKGNQLVLALCRDITVRNKRIEELKIFRELLDSSNDAIFVINLTNSHFIDVNQQSCDSLGYSKSELINLGIIDISKFLSNNKNWEAFLTKLKVKGKLVIEDYYIRNDGRELPVEVSVKYISYSNKEYLIALARDISERKKIEKVINDLAKLPEENANPVFRIAKNGNILYSNPAADKLILKRLSKNLISKEWDKVVNKAININSKTSVELKIDDKFFLFDITPVKETDYSIIYGVDITQRETAKKSIIKMQERLDMALKGANIGFWDWNITTGKVYYDEIWCSMLGYKREELRQHVSTWNSMLHPDDKDYALKELEKHFDDDSYNFTIEYRFKTKSNDWKWILGKGKVQERDFHGKPLRMLGIHLDITERLKMEEKIKAANKELKKLAFHDPLTNVINRNAFIDLLNKSIKNHSRQGKKLALLFIDVDKFKNINDLYGHHVGDKVLKYIALVIKACIRDSDFVGRLGGDEFVVCLKDISSLKNAAKVADKINKKLFSKVQLDNLMLQVGVSIGISCYPNDGKSGFSLMKASDLAMYKSKNIKANSFYVFNQEIADEIDFEYELELAFERKEFKLEFQRIYDLNGKLCCYEALLRWENKKYGRVLPDDFIHILERNRTFYKVGNWVIEEVCRSIKNFADHQHVSINISYSQLKHPEFYSTVVNIFKKYEINPYKISFEISEKNTSNVNMDILENVVQRLKEYGVGVVLDDFGAGQSSFSSLINLPIEIVKIDRYLISKMNDSKYYKNIIGLVTYLKTLSLKVVAEGVETKEQYETLKEIGCDYFQGFYFSKPEIII